MQSNKYCIRCCAGEYSSVMEAKTSLNHKGGGEAAGGEGGGTGGGVAAGVSRVPDVGDVGGERGSTGGGEDDTADSEPGSTIPIGRP